MENSSRPTLRDLPVPAKLVLHSERASSGRRVRTLLACTGASALAACINPAGPSLYHFALTVSTTEGKKAIVEPERVLTIDEVVSRVCEHFSCPRTPHLVQHVL